MKDYQPYLTIANTQREVISIKAISLNIKARRVKRKRFLNSLSKHFVHCVDKKKHSTISGL